MRILTLFNHDVMNSPVNVNTFRIVEFRNYQMEKWCRVMALYTLFIKTYCMSVCLYREERSFIGALLKKEKKSTESAPGRLRASSRCTLNAVATTSGRQNIFSRLRI